MPEKKSPQLQVLINDYELERVLDVSVRAAIDKQVGKSLAEHVDELVACAIKERVDAITGEMLKAKVEQVLAEGWARTNEWGEKRGEVINLDSTVREGLKKFTAGNANAYNERDRRSQLQELVEAMAAEGVKKGLQPVIDEAKKQLQSQLDISIGKSLRLTLADALKG